MSTSSKLKLCFLTPRLRLGVAARTLENDFPPLSSVRTRFGLVPCPPPYTHTHTGQVPSSRSPARLLLCSPLRPLCSPPPCPLFPAPCLCF
jgi:hypothetical protein